MGRPFRLAVCRAAMVYLAGTTGVTDMPTVETEKATIYYEAHGDGPPVVFAHGGGGNTLEWFQQMPAFTKRYRCILFDHRGWGRSRCDVDDIDPRYFPGDVFAVMDGRRRRAMPHHRSCDWRMDGACGGNRGAGSRRLYRHVGDSRRRPNRALAACVRHWTGSGSRHARHRQRRLPRPASRSGALS